MGNIMGKDNLVFAKHDNCSQEFLFAVPWYLEVRKGDVLLVDTIHGEAVALMARFLSLGQKEGLLRRNLEFYEVTFACSSITSIINLVDAGNEELLHKEFTKEELEEKAYEIFLRLLG